MPKVYGDLDLQNGRILNLKIELVETTPTFDLEEKGRLIFVNSENAFKINTGSEWITIQFSNTNNNPLLITLGDNWINDDSSFNPVPFNALDNIEGLTSNDSLFSVFVKLDEAISSIETINIDDLQNVNFANLTLGDIVFFNGENFSNASLNDLANTVMQLPIEKLSNVNKDGNFLNGQFLVYKDNFWINKKVYFEYTNFAANTNFAITHNLDTRFCTVQVIDLNTFRTINDAVVIYDSVNKCTVILTESKPIKVLLTAFS